MHPPHPSNAPFSTSVRQTMKGMLSCQCTRLEPLKEVWDCARQLYREQSWHEVLVQNTITLNYYNLYHKVEDSIRQTKLQKQQKLWKKMLPIFTAKFTIVRFGMNYQTEPNHSIPHQRIFFLLNTMGHRGLKQPLIRFLFSQIHPVIIMMSTITSQKLVKPLWSRWPKVIKWAAPFKETDIYSVFFHFNSLKTKKLLNIAEWNVTNDIYFIEHKMPTSIQQDGKVDPTEKYTPKS